MNELFEALKPSILAIITLIATTLVSYLTIKAKELLVAKAGQVNALRIKSTIQDVVNCVEQIGKLWGSEEKLADAKRRALLILSEQGLNITEIELDTLIESVVKDFYGHWEESPLGEEAVEPKEITE